MLRECGNIRLSQSSDGMTKDMKEMVLLATRECYADVFGSFYQEGRRMLPMLVTVIIHTYKYK